MKPYLIALGVGVLVGVIYGMLNVRSPAPPVIALIGLLGILLGEQVVPVVKRLYANEAISRQWVSATCGQHVFGKLPSAAQAEDSRIEPQTPRSSTT